MNIWLNYWMTIKWMSEWNNDRMNDWTDKWQNIFFVFFYVSQVDIRNTGKTALHLSAWYNHRDVVRLLLDCGADVTAADNDGDTPLHNAALRWDNVTLTSTLT